MKLFHSLFVLLTKASFSHETNLKPTLKKVRSINRGDLLNLYLIPSRTHLTRGYRQFTGIWELYGTHEHTDPRLLRYQAIQNSFNLQRLSVGSLIEADFEWQLKQHLPALQQGLKVTADHAQIDTITAQLRAKFNRTSPISIALHQALVVPSP
jgi:hypothetical protein